MTLVRRFTVVAFYALFYYCCFYLNKFIFDDFEFSFGVNWVFIPSGLQLLMVLIAIEYGALSIAIASLIIGFENYQLDSLTRTLITGLISGGSPLLARKVCIDFLGIDKELANITPKSILTMSIVFSLISATLHQLWFSYVGVTERFTHSLFVMALGDFFGTALVLTLLSTSLRLFKAYNPSS